MTDEKMVEEMEAAIAGEHSNYGRAQAAATIAQGRIEELEAALRRALNFIENTESEHNIELGCGDIARAALNPKDK